MCVSPVLFGACAYPGHKTATDDDVYDDDNDHIYDGGCCIATLTGGDD